jgi:predicted nucleic acid-binding protein
LTDAPVAVVLDVNVLVSAVASGNTPFHSWPSPPPVSDNPAADCVGVMNDSQEFAFGVSEHILINTGRVLTEGYEWSEDDVEDYLDLLVEIAEASGGDYTEPSTRVNDCPDYEGNRILELALECDADLIVGDDHHLLSMSPWRGRPIMSARDFANRVDAMRRGARRRRP